MDSSGPGRINQTRTPIPDASGGGSTDEGGWDMIDLVRIEILAQRLPWGRAIPLLACRGEG